MKFIAKRQGFFNGNRVRPGQTFEAKAFKGSWADPVVEEKEEGAAQVAPSVSEKPKPKKKRKTRAKKSKPIDPT